MEKPTAVDAPPHPQIRLASSAGLLVAGTLHRRVSTTVAAARCAAEKAVVARGEARGAEASLFIGRPGGCPSGFPRGRSEVAMTEGGDSRGRVTPPVVRFVTLRYVISRHCIVFSQLEKRRELEQFETFEPFGTECFKSRGGVTLPSGRRENA